MAAPSHRLKLPREHYIPISVPQLAKACSKYLPTPMHKQWHKFCAMLQAIYHYRLLDSSKSLKMDYMLFSPTAGKKERERKRSRRNADIHMAEDRLLDGIVGAMEKANYKVLGKREWDMSLADDFSMNLPIDLRWDLHDTEMLTRYLQQRPDFLQSATPFAKHALVFYRGIGRTQASGLFISRKIDQLLDLALWRPLHAMFTGQRPEKVVSTSEEALSKEAEEKDSDSMYAERQTLEQSLSTTSDVIKKFSTKLTIKEPTYKSMVVLYRDAPTKAGADPTVWIKSFRNVPLADLELVFPHKKIYIKTVELIKFWGMVIVAIVIAIQKLLEARSGGSDFTGASFMLLTLLGSKAAQMYGSMTRTMQHNKDLMTKLLYEHSLDTGEGEAVL
jgi:hypothetical protein